MKRRIGALLAMALGACSGPADQPVEAPQAAESDWAAPPRIESVTRSAGALVVVGQAGPGARVVLRSPVGAAFAASADAQGRFELRMTPPAGDVLLTPVVQVGERAAAAPERLMILAGGAGPVALLSPGGPSRRLDPAPALDALDTDGAALVASGRGQAGRAVSLSIDGGQPVSASAARDGRWTAMLGSAAPATVVVGGQRFAWSGAAPDRGGPLDVQRIGGGWKVSWPISPTARQTSWFPEAPA
jgi:hypothetical protein